METIHFSDARQRLADVFDQVTRDKTPLEIHRRSKPSVVVMDKDEFDGVMETLHLLSSPNNAARLLESINQASTEQWVEPDLEPGR